MPSFNIDFNFSDHPKVLRIIGRLGNGADAMLVRLWNFTARFYGDDGFLVGYSGAEIEATIRWWGEPGLCIKAMLDLGFVTEIENGFQVHDWSEHQSHIRAYREKAKDMNEKRIAKATGQTPKKTAKAKSDYVVNDVVNYVVNDVENKGSEPSALLCSALQGSSFKEPVRETFNRGIHTEAAQRSATLVKSYLAAVKTSHRSTAKPAESILAQIILDEPMLNDVDVLRGIEVYARECEARSDPPDMRCSPLKFFTERRWEVGDIEIPKGETGEERARKTKERIRKQMESSNAVVSQSA